MERDVTCTLSECRHCLQTLDCAQAVTSVQICEDDTIVTGNMHGDIRLLDVRSGKLICAWTDHEEPITNIDYSKR